jgi:adenine deaminase
MPKAPLADRIDQGRGITPADLVLKGAQVFDLITGELVPTDVAICGDTIVGVFGTYHGRQELDFTGRILVPGFIDTHLHIESSLVDAARFARSF